MSVCLNHTDRPAGNRCKSCLKPCCDECATQGPDGGIYCGQGCIENFLKFRERMEALGPIKPPGSPFDVLRAPFLIIMGLLFAMVVVWMVSPSSAPTPVGRFIETNIYHKTPSPKPGKHKKEEVH